MFWQLFFAVAPIVVANAAAQPTPPLEFRVRYETVDIPLTTEKISEWDPGVLNPHRRRWALKRELSLEGLTTEETAEGRHQIVSGPLVLNMKSAIRPAGPWYSSPSAFPCSLYQKLSGPGAALVRGADSSAIAQRFAVPSGAAAAAAASAKKFEELASKLRPQLASRLASIRKWSREDAIAEAEWELESWSEQVEKVWREFAPLVEQRAEWTENEKESGAALLCKRKSSAVGGQSRWETLMEPLVPTVQGKRLAHVPAQLWDGEPVVRITVEALGKKLIGQFLVDPSAPTSLVNPQFLSAQGVNSLALIPPGGGKPEKVTWHGKSAFGKRIEVDAVEISGISMRQDVFVLADTLEFEPPWFLKNCCDGVLGNDFLRSHTVRFETGRAPRLVVFQAEGFQPGVDAAWAEVGIDTQGRVVSECFDSKKKPVTLAWKFWDPPRPGARHLEVHDCNGYSIMGKGWFSGFKGSFTLDLPHGRVIFDAQRLLQDEVWNRTGLIYDFEWKSIIRKLKVVGLQPGSEAEKLRRRGLEPGMYLTAVGGRDASDWDVWLLDQHLSGRELGSTIADPEHKANIPWETTLEWKSREGRPISATLRLR